MENNNLNVLDEVNKGATMGMDAIFYISEKVKDDTFKKVLDGEYNKYKDISTRINEIYPNFSDKQPHETNAMNKMMTWYGVQMNTLNDKSNSKLSELNNSSNPLPNAFLLVSISFNHFLCKI